MPTSTLSNGTSNGISNGDPASNSTSNGVGNGKPAQEPLDASKTVFQYSQTLKPIPEPGSPELWEQNAFSDHMITARWSLDKGWDAPKLEPFGNISISPAASCLHYATQCFEGMKVYRGFDGKLRLFRPERNARRLLMSSERVSLPGFDEEELVKLIKMLVRADCPRWLPKERPGNFLYIRPAVIGNGGQIGIQIPKEATILIMMVAWPEFSTETPPGAPPAPSGMRLFASENGTARAWPGGFGYAKLGANYGPNFAALSECRKRGYDQVLWLLGSDCQVTEAGSSNFFAIVKNAATGKAELITASLDDKVILEGVTRQSVLDLARSRLSNDLQVLEKKFTMHELQNAWKEGRLFEAFVSGTAFFISPVSLIHFEGEDWDVPMTRKGADQMYAMTIKEWLKDIMYGVESHEWGVVVDGEKL